MSLIPFYGIPNKLEHVIQLCGTWPAKVVQVGSPNGEGDVKVDSPVFGGESSNWIPNGALGCGTGGDKMANRKHTGLYNPAQPGQSGYIVFMPGSGYNKPVFMLGGVYMSEKGKA